MITLAMRNKEFETSPSILRDVFYGLERSIGNLFFKRSPSKGESPRLLNLGCGPLIYAGWCNADDFAFKRSLREKSFRPEWRLDITKPWKCENNFWDGIFSQHVIEHVRYSQATFVMEECFRTLKPGAWIRMSVPSVSKYVDFYNDMAVQPEFMRFPHKALALSFMTQMHFHKSTWDAGLMTAVLSEIGFVNVREVNFGEGSDRNIIQDQSDKAWESLYIEAQKPV
jgi:predicted SAM-dependent methyltransferase